MANVLVNIKFIENSRGGQTLIHDDYMFSLKMKKRDSSYWYCKTRGCNVKINTKEGILTKVNHTHQSDHTGVSVAEMMRNIRKRVRETVEPVPSIYDHMLSTLRTPEWDEDTEAVVSGLPTFYSSRSSLYRQRSKLLPVLP